jgi:hypothetical protein
MTYYHTFLNNLFLRIFCILLIILMFEIKLNAQSKISSNNLFEFFLSEYKFCDSSILYNKNFELLVNPIEDKYLIL